MFQNHQVWWCAFWVLFYKVGSLRKVYLTHDCMHTPWISFQGPSGKGSIDSTSFSLMPTQTNSPEKEYLKLRRLKQLSKCSNMSHLIREIWTQYLEQSLPITVLTIQKRSAVLLGLWGQRWQWAQNPARYRPWKKNYILSKIKVQ